MELHLRTHRLDVSSAIQDKVRRRIELGLERIAQHVVGAAVTLTDVNGPRGGLDKRCVIRLRGGFAPVVIEHLGGDLLETASAAAERAERAVLRAIARRRAA